MTDYDFPDGISVHSNGIANEAQQQWLQNAGKRHYEALRKTWYEGQPPCPRCGENTESELFIIRMGDTVALKRTWDCFLSLAGFASRTLERHPVDSDPGQKLLAQLQESNV